MLSKKEKIVKILSENVMSSEILYWIILDTFTYKNKR
jgi:hypothetical protein